MIILHNYYLDVTSYTSVAKARIGELELVTFDQGLKKLNHL
jgi:hypothetical protein